MAAETEDLSDISELMIVDEGAAEKTEQQPDNLDIFLKSLTSEPSGQSLASESSGQSLEAEPSGQSLISEPAGPTMANLGQGTSHPSLPGLSEAGSSPSEPGLSKSAKKKKRPKSAQSTSSNESAGTASHASESTGTALHASESTGSASRESESAGTASLAKPVPERMETVEEGASVSAGQSQGVSASQSPSVFAGQQQGVSAGQSQGVSPGQAHSHAADKKKKKRRPKSAQQPAGPESTTSAAGSVQMDSTSAVLSLSLSMEQMTTSDASACVAGGGGAQQSPKKKNKKKKKKDAHVEMVEEDGAKGVRQKNKQEGQSGPVLPEAVLRIQQSLNERQQKQKHPLSQDHHHPPHYTANILHNHHPLPYHQQQQHPHQGQHQGHQKGHTPQNQGSGKKKEHHKKNIFEPYWPMEKVSEGLKRGILVEGKIRINPKNFEDAYVPLPDGSSDVYISGLPNRNRALNGDIVAVLVGERDDWRVFTDEVNYYEETNSPAPTPMLSPKPEDSGETDTTQDPDNSVNMETPNTGAGTEEETTQATDKDQESSPQDSTSVAEEENEKGSTEEQKTENEGESVSSEQKKEEGEESKGDSMERMEEDDEGGADVVVEEEEEVELDEKGNPVEGTQVIRPGCGAVTPPPKHPSSASSTPGVPSPSDRSPGKGKKRHRGKRAGQQNAASADGVSTSSGKSGNSASSTRCGSATGSPGKAKRFTSVKDMKEHPSPVVKRLFAGGQGSGTSVEEVKLERFMQRTGKVVAIIDKKHSRAASGNLRPLQENNTHFAIFSPTDSRIPRIMIAANELPEGFKERPEDFAKVLYITRITEWHETSKMPKGALMRSLGEAGQVEPETEALLVSNGVDDSEFSPEVIACLPQNLPWSIPAEELALRRDLREECIFTIDPATARDLDDALHCTDLGDGTYEVGVHIADVSYFVKEGTELDEVAMSRATSVYLVQKVVPMLPRLLCEQLCSLNPNEDRLTFSVIWKMTEGGQILEEWFGRSVIRSCAKLSYDHAQGFIEEPDRCWTSEELPPISGNFTADDLKKRVLQMDKMAKAMRKARFDSGALRLDQVKIQFTLNKESGLPDGYSVYQQRDSNKLVEEFMLLANMAVAHKIKKSFRNKAVLRRHPPPQSRMVDELKALCNSLGFPIEVATARDIQLSLARYTGEDELSKARLQVLVVLCSKPMQNARYFCCGVLADEKLYHHYALNVPLYTHFTSPIRRYPDILVHRTLAASLGYCMLTDRSPGELQKISEVCNEKKTNAKTCSEKSNDLYFAIFVKEAGPLEERGMVMAVLDKSFDVYVLSFGVVKRVYCEKLPLASFSYRKDGKRPELTLVWNADDGCQRMVTQKLSIFSGVNSILLSDPADSMRWMASIRRPTEGDPTIVSTSSVIPPH